ncbi:hypothetical protein HK101_006673 [Irineochytrium annulatum]|nr:hypothetical protein HK101_006673 [Irineochytrium annulatum]
MARTRLLAVGAAVVGFLAAGVDADSTVSTSTYENCGGGTHLNILGANVIFHQNNTADGYVGVLQLIANVTSDVEIIQGGAEVSALVLGHTFQLENDDFCSLTSCPIHKKSRFTVRKNVSVTMIPPPGVEIQIRVNVHNGQSQLGCFDVRFDFRNDTYNVAVTLVSLRMSLDRCPKLLEETTRQLERDMPLLLQPSTVVFPLVVTPQLPLAFTGEVLREDTRRVRLASMEAVPRAAKPLLLVVSTEEGEGMSRGPAVITGVVPQGHRPGPTDPSSYGPGGSGGPAAPASYGPSGGAGPAAPSAYGPGVGAGPADPTAYGPGGGTGPSAPTAFGPGGASGPTAPAAFGPGGASGPSAPNAFGPGGASGPSAPTAFGPGGAAGPGAPTAYGPGGAVAGAPNSFAAGPIGPANVAGGGNVVVSGGGGGLAAATTAGQGGSGFGQNYLSAPWFFDIIHYFQFITLSGQLQLDYPTVFSTFSRIFHFSNGGVRIAFIEAAVESWTGVSSVWNTSTIVVANATGLGSVVTTDDVGLTSFIIQTGLAPANYFPTTLITLLFMVLIMGVVSVLVSVGIMIFGEVFKKKEDEEQEMKEEKLALQHRLRKEAKIVIRKRAVLIRFCLANLLRAWMIAQYPITVASAYWLSHFASSPFAPVSVTVVAAIVLIMFCVSLPVSLITIILRVKPVDRLFTDKNWFETLGPLYDQYRVDRVAFAAVLPAYYALQGLAVGLFPKNAPRQLTETLNTPQWFAALFQPLSLVAVEIAFMVALYRFDPFQDRFSGRMQWAVSWSRLLVLVCVCCFAAPEYKRDLGDNASNDDITNNYTGGAIWTFKDVMAYFGALVHALLVISLLGLMLRRVYIWCRNFYISRRTASLASSSAGDSTPRGFKRWTQTTFGTGSKAPAESVKSSETLLTAEVKPKADDA